MDFLKNINCNIFFQGHVYIFLYLEDYLKIIAMSLTLNIINRT